MRDAGNEWMLREQERRRACSAVEIFESVGCPEVT